MTDCNIIDKKYKLVEVYRCWKCESNIQPRETP